MEINDLTFDDTILMAWFKSYVAELGEDQHSRFAERLGVSRADAKQLCYRIAYTVNKSKVMEAYCGY